MDLRSDLISDYGTIELECGSIPGCHCSWQMHIDPVASQARGFSIFEATAPPEQAQSNPPHKRR